MTEHATGQKVQEYPRIDEVTADTLFEAFKNGYKSATAQQIADFTGSGGGGGGTSNGIELITSVTISSPVAYLDIAFPVGYDSFSIQLIGITQSNHDLLAAAFSKDAGDTFICDAAQFDTYTNLFVDAFSVNGEALATVVYLDSLMSLGDKTHPDQLAIRQNATIFIDPGDAANFPALTVNAIGSISADASVFALSQIGQVVNTDATITPTVGRVNLIRIQPYGNGDCDPPTSGRTIDGGSYFLWGVPTP